MSSKEGKRMDERRNGKERESNQTRPKEKRTKGKEVEEGGR